MKIMTECERSESGSKSETQALIEPRPVLAGADPSSCGPGDAAQEQMRSQESQKASGQKRAVSKASALFPDYGTGILVVAACTLVCLAMRPYFDPANLIMVYLLGTIFVVIKRGIGPALLSSVLGVLVFDLIFVPPLYLVSVSDSQYLFTVATMFVIASIVGKLTEHIQKQMRDVQAKEARTRVMLSMTRELAGVRGAAGLLRTLTDQILRLHGCHCVVYLDEMSGFSPGEGTSMAVRPARHADETARWVLANGQPAGPGTLSFPHGEALCLPMSGVEGTLAVLAVWPKPTGSTFTLEQMHLLESLARQVGLMLELERLEGERQRHQLVAQSERLKTSLLSSVTHDIQTPLAAIMGSAESLLLHGSDMDDEEREGLTEGIRDEAARLSRLVANLLRMTKLESGAVKPDLQLQPIDEPLGAALVLMNDQMAGRELELHVPEDLPLLALDAVLMEQYFLNVLENAVKYAAQGGPLTVAARREEEHVLVEIADRGPGLAKGELERVFDLFYQGGAGPGQPKGYGLGLAVCRAIAQVHGGTLVAAQREGGGAVFRLTLPVPTGDQGTEMTTEDM